MSFEGNHLKRLKGKIGNCIRKREIEYEQRKFELKKQIDVWQVLQDGTGCVEGTARMCGRSCRRG
jgi:hypothetical protein